MSGTLFQRFIAATTALALLLGSGTSRSALAAVASPVANLIEESKTQQEKVKELGEKLRKAGEAYQDAVQANKPDAATLGKTFQELQGEYDKELTKFREICKKLDDAAKQGGESGDAAATAREEGFQNLGKMIGDLIAGILGAFFGQNTVERDQFLGAATKAALGAPLTSEEIASLAKVPKDKLGITGTMASIYNSFQSSPSWPVVRESLVTAAVQQIGESSPAAQAIKVVHEKLKDAKALDEATCADIKTAVAKALTSGKFNTEESKKEFLDLVSTFAPPNVVATLQTIPIDE